MIIHPNYPIRKFTEYSFQDQVKENSFEISPKNNCSNKIKKICIDKSAFKQPSSISDDSTEILDFFSKGLDDLLFTDINDINQPLLINLKHYRQLCTLISSQILSPQNQFSKSRLKLLYDSFNLVSSKICHFSITLIKENLQNATTVNDISNIYLKCKNKMNSISSAFSPLCISKYNLNFDFNELFKKSLNSIFLTNQVAINIQTNSALGLESKKAEILKVSEFFDGKKLYDHLSEIIIQFFIENILRKSFFVSSEDEDFNLNNSDIGNSLQFMKDTGNLFEIDFIPLFIDAILAEYTPTINQIFERHEIVKENGETEKLNLKDYLDDTDAIENELNESIKRISFILTDSIISEIKISFKKLFFASKLDQICKFGLRNLLVSKDIATIEKCAELARLTDKIKTFAHELSFDFESTVSDCFKNNLQSSENTKINPIRESIEYMNILNQLIEKSFSQHDKMLKEYFRKGFNVMPDCVARLTAEEVNYVFLHLEFYTTINRSASLNEYFVDMTFMDNLTNIFKFLNRTDVFEVYHHLLLSHRVLMLKTSTIYADEIFANWLRGFCGADYTQRMDTIFADLHKSSKIIRQFNEENMQNHKPTPSFFNALILSQSSWIADKLNEDDSKIEVPPFISPILSQFSQFYLQHNPNKRFIWSHHLSRVKLQIDYNYAGFSTIIKEIQCNGIIATIFCLFNQSKYLTKNEIMEKTNGSESTINECLKVMKSKKTGKLLKQNKSKDIYYLNLDSPHALKIIDSNGTISYPLLKMIAPKNEVATANVMIDRNCTQQIDAAVIRFLKLDHTMEKEALKDKVRDQINFRLEDEMYEKELQNLATRLYIRIDQAGKVHYLP